MRRILWVKAKHQVLVPAGKKKRVHDVLTQPYALLAHQQQAQHVPTQVADRIARQAITLVRNEGHLLPLTDDRYDRVVVIAPNGALAKRLRQESHLQVFTMPSRLERHQRNAIAREIAQKAAQAEALVLVVANGYHVDIARLVTGLVPGLPTVLVSMASPYYLTQVPNVQGYVCSYSDTESAQRALANALIGAAPMPGRLPVSIPGMYAYDHEWQETAALGRVVTP